ncbi:MAG: TonB-dependent receptor [Acidobacteriota bacterium]
MKRISIVAFTLLFWTAAVLGQGLSGVTGVVTDSTGAIVPGVTVTLLDTKTSKEQSTVTNDSGSYTFNSIEPGAGFKLTFTRQGFQTYSLNGVQISVGRTDSQNVVLTAGDVAAVVEVTSTSGDATLNSTDGSIGNVIGTRQLQELPIQIRGTPAALIGLQPGAVGSNVFAGSTGGNRTGSVTGSRADQGNITVDGIDANDVTTGQAFNTVANAPIDSIQEFRGTVAGFGATDGRSSGGQVQLKTNSGTNDFHGNLREYYRTEQTAANTFFNNQSGIARPALRRHQFGGSLGGPLPYLNFGENNGPIFKSGKDRLFFFFDTENRRDRSQTTNAAVVPLQSFRDGKIAYINNNAGCTSAARVNTTPNCISYLSPTDIQALDPQHVGINQALLGLYNSRFPLPNDLTGGDGRNTGLYRFNSPNTRDDHIHTFRFDAVPTDRQRIFVRTTLSYRDSTNSAQFLPQDPDSVKFQDRSYGIAAGHTWIISPSLTNILTLGISKSNNVFTPPNIPTFPYSFSGGTLGSPFPSLSYQDRHVAVPTFRDDVTWTAGSHTIFAGFSFKPTRQKSSLINDFTFVSLGLGGSTSALAASLRPANLLVSTSARTGYDTALTTLLGRIASMSTNYNYSPTGQALAPGTGKLRNYAYNEYEYYVQDNWKLRNDFTVNLGMRYYYYPAPYETNGLLADNRTDWKSLFNLRKANAAAGIAGDTAEPFLTYELAGKTNNRPPLYETDKNNFAPRVGFAWNPSFKGGVLGAIMGDRKTVIRGTYDVTYDRVSGAILFIQNQSDYIFQNTGSRSFGNINSVTALLTDPRFTAINSTTVNTVAPVITRPLTPFVSGGVPTGIVTGETNYAIDHNFKTPYSKMFTFGIQRELPGNHLLDVSYVGRLGRSLFVQSDVAQVTNFRDNASGQLLFNAFNNLQAQLAAGGAITPIAWFENQLNPMSIASYGVPCSGLGLGNNCTELVGNPGFTGGLISIGDTSDTIQALNSNGLLKNNVGLSAQFATNAFITNQGNSDYHGLLVSLRKRYSKGFQYELNYTYSHSFDNNSTVANTVFGGLVCDVNNPDICRGPSDFDIRHLFNGNFILDLPFGRGKWLGRDMNRYVDAIFGGWTVSGIVSARSGLPFSASPSAGSYPLSYVLGSPAIITNVSAFKPNIHNTGSTIQYFADPAAAQAAMRDPHHGELGSRNLLRGPSFWGLDMGLAKRFSAPWNERQRFTLRVDAFNVTNTNQFGLPNATRASGSFGQITGSSNTPRELQFALRFDF